MTRVYFTLDGRNINITEGQFENDVKAELENEIASGNFKARLLRETDGTDDMGTTLTELVDENMEVRRDFSKMEDYDLQTIFTAEAQTMSKSEFDRLTGEMNRRLTAKQAKKQFKLNGLTAILNSEGEYDIFTADEMLQPKAFRYADITIETEAEAREWMKSY